MVSLIILKNSKNYSPGILQLVITTMVLKLKANLSNPKDTTKSALKRHLYIVPAINLLLAILEVNFTQSKLIKCQFQSYH